MIVHDEVKGINIQTSGSDIGSHQNRKAFVGELYKPVVTVSLLQVTVNGA
jgi:hypothetical protein